MPLAGKLVWSQSDSDRHRRALRTVLPLVALVPPAKEGQTSRHFVGLPPMEHGEPDTRERMGWPRVVVITTRPDGIFLERFGATGAEVGDTWHRSAAEAREQAAGEYGGELNTWTVVPGDHDDPVAFALRLAEASD